MDKQALSNMPWMQIWLFIATVTSQCALNNANMTSQARDLCTSTCTCVNRRISCRKAHLADVPRITLSVVSIDFGNNFITSITNSTFQQNSLDNVETLFLDKNELTHVESGALITLRKLRVLNLSQNNLNKLN